MDTNISIASRIKVTKANNSDIRACEHILRSLNKWFGIEEATAQYVADIGRLPTLLAKDEDLTVGFLSFKRHFQFSAEIHVMGVLPNFHRHGIGRILVERLIEGFQLEGVRWLQVKTLSPSRESEEYRLTRAFYTSLGFEPVEEFKTLWSEANPCLLMMKWLGNPINLPERNSFQLLADSPKIRLEQANPGHQLLFEAWGKANPIEELTCRPIVDGRRVSSTPESVKLVCIIDGETSPVGRVTAFDFNSRNRSAEFGYVVDPNRRGTGVGKCMLIAFLDYAFQKLNLNRLYCQTGSFNTPSVRLLESLGFTREAILRQHHELNGRFFDDYLFALLRNEWEEIYTKG